MIAFACKITNYSGINRNFSEIFETDNYQFAAFEQTGEPVAIIIDEYDSPLLEVMHEGEMLDKLRKVMQEFYAPLKACEGSIKFCFITGITKFSQLSIFSTINNLLNVTMEPKFAAICGITEEELTTVMAKDIKQLAEVYEVILST